ncbi:hypothetical protein AMTRI_Chr01g103080 [Amborella trichopoda]
MVIDFCPHGCCLVGALASQPIALIKFSFWVLVGGVVGHFCPGPLPNVWCLVSGFVPLIYFLCFFPFLLLLITYARTYQSMH